MESLSYQTNQRYASPISNSHPPQIHEIILCGMVGLFGIFGSGSNSSSVQKERGVYRYVVPSREKQDLDEIIAGVKAISEQLTIIKESLKLNISHLADLLDVSRPSVYAWLKGENPNAVEIVKKIHFFEIEASKIAELKLERVDNMIKRPLFEEKSVLELLKQGISIHESHLRILKELDSKETQVRATNSSSKSARKFKDAVEDVATPLWLS